jgi:hypothetical protein
MTEIERFMSPLLDPTLRRGRRLSSGVTLTMGR